VLDDAEIADGSAGVVDPDFVTHCCSDLPCGDRASSHLGMTRAGTAEV
jgi:hypothetical protein